MDQEKGNEKVRKREVKSKEMRKRHWRWDREKGDEIVSKEMRKRGRKGERDIREREEMGTRERR